VKSISPLVWPLGTAVKSREPVELGLGQREVTIEHPERLHARNGHARDAGDIGIQRIVAATAGDGGPSCAVVALAMIVLLKSELSHLTRLTFIVASTQ
jgi:hypothetical protein